MRHSHHPLITFAVALLTIMHLSPSAAQTTPASTPTPPIEPAAQAEPAIAVTSEQVIKLLKVTNGSSAAQMKRVAVTSCNVLFGYESSADAKTQAGFGQQTSGRTDASVYSKYSLIGISPEAKQAITDKVCADAAKSFADAGLEVVSADEMTARPEWKALQATGIKTPYDWSRKGSKYTLHTPTGYSMTEVNTYLSTMQIFSAVGNAMSADTNPAKIEADLMKALNAASARVNILVDFAKQESNSAKGFFGRISGNDTAKVDSKVQLSISGYVAFHPLETLYCSNNMCFTSQGKTVSQFALTEPMRATRAVVLETKDLKATGTKVAEVAVNVMGALMAVSGYRGTSVSSEEWGVVVDPVAYEQAVREHTNALVTAATQTAKKS